MEKFFGKESFSSYCSALFGQYSNSLKSVVQDSTEMIFELIQNPITLELRPSRDIQKGKFYMIDYSYNGNDIWCPIFVIDDRYNTENQKRIIYGINLDYLRYDYKINIFDYLFKVQENVIKYNKESNDRNENVLKEIPFKINFESFYNILKKTGDHNYAINSIQLYENKRNE